MPPDPSAAVDIYEIVERISKLTEPENGGWAKELRPAGAGENDQNAAIGILNRLTSFAYFGITVIDAFSDPYFDLEQVKQNTRADSGGSYGQLAVARIELSIFAASAKIVLERFRKAIIRPPG